MVGARGTCRRHHALSGLTPDRTGNHTTSGSQETGALFDSASDLHAPHLLLAQLDPLCLVRNQSGSLASLDDLERLQAMGDEKGAFQQMLARQCEAQSCSV